MDIAEKKREYDALKALASRTNYAATAVILIGLLWLKSFNLFVVVGFLGFFAATSLELYARFRFGLIKSFYWWLTYQILIAVLVLGLLLVPFAFDLFG